MASKHVSKIGNQPKVCHNFLSQFIFQFMTMYQAARFLISVSPVLMGVYLLFGAFSDISASQSAAQWPAVQGVVIEQRRSSLFSLYNRYSYISYQYEIDGNRLTGQRIAFGSGSASDYEARQSVEVYYNPLDHSDSVLEVGFRAGYLFSLLVAVGLMLVGKVLWKRLK